MLKNTPPLNLSGVGFLSWDILKASSLYKIISPCLWNKRARRDGFAFNQGDQNRDKTPSETTQAAWSGFRSSGSMGNMASG